MMAGIRPRRSVLYVPGSNPRALEKAKSLPCDAVILDLEDSVGPGQKDDARKTVAAAISSGGYGAREVAVRINDLASPWGHDDLAVLAGSDADALLVPKVSRAGDLAAVRAGLGAAPGMALWAMIESPRSILNISQIAAMADDPAERLGVFVLGTNDLAKETGASLDEDRMALVPWLQTVLVAARAHGLSIIDGVYNTISDAEGFAQECRQGKTLGMDGKTVIHPGQINTANRVFSPGAGEIEWARKVLAAFALPENAGTGVIRLDGKMVERLHAEMAARIIAISEAI